MNTCCSSLRACSWVYFLSATHLDTSAEGAEQRRHLCNQELHGRESPAAGGAGWRVPRGRTTVLHGKKSGVFSALNEQGH